MNDTETNSERYGGAVQNTLILVISEDTSKEEILAQFEHTLLFPASHIRVRS